MPVEFTCFVFLARICEKHRYLVFSKNHNMGKSKGKKANKGKSRHSKSIMLHIFYRVGAGLGPLWFSEPRRHTTGKEI